MRKYNSGMRKSLIIIGAIFVVFVVVFSLFLNRYNKVKTTAYRIATGSVLFDNEQNKITTTDEAKMRMKWAGDYYLDYNDKNTNLGKHSVVYNVNTGDISLYGKFYEVKSNGKVNNLKDENIIKSSVKSRFFKLADRKYLIVDRTIEAVNSSFVTSNYLIINLDKSGNATLLNNRVSLKTITPTKLRTSSYTFDIANELLNFGGDDIDLKKIIGSSNAYDKDYDINKEDDDSSFDGSGNGSGGNSSGNGLDGGLGEGGDSNSSNGNANGGSGNAVNGNGTTKGTTSTYTSNYDSGVSDEAVDEIIKSARNISVIRITPNISSISVDYVIYDPDNEVKSVYVEIENTSTSQKKIVYLSKTDTNILLNGLNPNTYYNLTFKYTYDDAGQTTAYTFDTFGTYTRIPKMVLSVTSIIDNRLFFKVDLDNAYNVTGGSVSLLVDGQIVKSRGLPAQGLTSKITDGCFFDLGDLKLKRNNDTIITLKITSVSFNTYTVNPEISYKFKY